MSTLGDVVAHVIAQYLVIKFVLCVRRWQEGKTFIAIQRMRKEISQDAELGRSVHIVFTMNTLLNNKQFAKRLQAIEHEYGKGSVCVFASKYSGPYTHVTNRLELQGLCMKNATCPRIIVLCSNSRRFDDGIEFLKEINEYRDDIQEKAVIQRAFAYYDELHKYINDSLRSQIEEINGLDIIHGIMALTATPRPIWQRDSSFWSRIGIIDLDPLDAKDYAGCGDVVFNPVDDYFPNPYCRTRSYAGLEEDTLGFIEHVLGRYPEILDVNTRTFIPAHVLRTSHNRVRDLVFQRRADALVVVLNGQEKTLTYQQNGHVKTLCLASDDEEVCETIARYIKERGFEGRPLVITGFLCVGMGQTLMHKSYGHFTSAILSHLDLSNDDLTQLYGRVAGRIKEWASWKTDGPTQIYCPTVTMYRIQVEEKCNTNMAREFGGNKATVDDYDAPGKRMGLAGEAHQANIRHRHRASGGKGKGDDKTHRVFANQDDAIAFARTRLGKRINRRDEETLPASYMDDDGNRLTEERALKRWKNQGGGGDKPRMFPVRGGWILIWKRGSEVAAEADAVDAVESKEEAVAEVAEVAEVEEVEEAVEVPDVDTYHEVAALASSVAASAYVPRKRVGRPRMK